MKAKKSLTTLFPSFTEESLSHVVLCGFSLANFVATLSIKNVSFCLVLLRSAVTHTVSLILVPSDDEFSCEVCRKPVDINYGQHSCNKGCHYAVHSKCATKKNVWDGIDLERVPEEKEEDVDNGVICVGVPDKSDKFNN
ncbi:hypothetical protein Bca4012_097980 [Brassica carinata]